MPGVQPPQSGANAEPTFVALLAADTGLDRNVIEAWVNTEGAYAPGGTGGNNFLNIREGTSRSGVPITGTTSKGFAQFANASDAAKETAWWINHMPNYRGIKASAKMGPRSQLTAIAASPWDSGHYNGGRTLVAAYNSVVHAGGGIISGITGAVNSVARHVPGVAQVEDTASSVSTLTQDAGQVIGFLFNPEDWLRIGYIIGGGILALGGLFIMAKSVGGSSTVQQAALMATPEGRAATMSGMVPSGKPKEKQRPAPRTRTRTVYVTDPEENRRQRVRQRAAASSNPETNDIPF